MNLRNRAVIRPHQGSEEVVANPIEIGTAEIPERLHTVEAGPPGVNHLWIGGAAERELFVRECEVVQYLESGPLEVASEFPTHMKIVATFRERITRIGLEK